MKYIPLLFLCGCAWFTDNSKVIADGTTHQLYVENCLATAKKSHNLGVSDADVEKSFEACLTEADKVVQK